MNTVNKDRKIDARDRKFRLHINRDYPFSNEGNDNTPRECKHCGWKGKQRDCNFVRVNSSPGEWIMLAGRAGIEYHCPKCDWMISVFYWAMS